MNIEELDDLKLIIQTYHEDACTTNTRFGTGCSCRFGILLDEIIAAFPMSDHGDRVEDINTYKIARNGVTVPLTFSNRDDALDWISREIRNGAWADDFEILDGSDDL